MPTMRMFKIIAVTVSLPVLSGCSAISAITDATTPLAVYELRTPESIATVQGRPLARDVIIELPTTSGALATDRIMIRPDPLQAQYLPDVRWADPMPVMMQTLMLRAIEATQGVRYVGRQPLGSSGDFAIVTEIIDFQAELNADGETATVSLNMVLRIVREQDARIVASRRFDASAPSQSTDTQDLIKAFDTGVTLVLPLFAEWALSEMARL